MCGLKKVLPFYAEEPKVVPTLENLLERICSTLAYDHSKLSNDYLDKKYRNHRLSQTNLIVGQPEENFSSEKDKLISKLQHRVSSIQSQLSKAKNKEKELLDEIINLRTLGHEDYETDGTIR